MTVTCRTGARHATRSLAEVLHPVDVADPTSSDQATWNQPVGFIESGGLAILQNDRALNVKMRQGSNPCA